MRFLEKGADIPDELVRAVTSGSVTFLCGAGVSFRAKLPSFKKLTEQVYGLLGESADDEAAERNAIANEQYDRALQSVQGNPVYQQVVAAQANFEKMMAKVNARIYEGMKQGAASPIITLS